MLGYASLLPRSHADESSYSPGLLRPSLGSVAQLKSLIFEAHAHNIPVILDLDWESSKRDSLLCDYHNFYTCCARRQIDLTPRQGGDQQSRNRRHFPQRVVL